MAGRIVKGELPHLIMNRKEAEDNQKEKSARS